MALREDYIRCGQWLFRYRSFIPLVLFVFVFLVIYFDLDKFYTFTPHIYCCIIISIMGVFVRCCAVGDSHKNTSGRNRVTQVADDINTTGIYSLLRHPLYLGNYLIWLGMSLFTGSLLITLFAFLFFWRYYEIIMFTEEEYLRGKFGQKYEDWANRVPAVIPNGKNYVKNATMFSIKKVIRKENDGVYAIVLGYFYVRFITDFSKGEMINIHDPWVYTVGVATILYIIVKILKKKTNILKG